MKIKTSELSDAALDWAVAKCNVRHHETVLTNHSYWVGERDPAVKPKHTGAFMVTDPDDIDSYAIVGDDKDALIIEAHDTLFDEVRYSTDWSVGGPIIEREKINITLSTEYSDDWRAEPHDMDSICQRRHGPTPLVAAMRCFCASKLGTEIEIPEELK